MNYCGYGTAAVARGLAGKLQGSLSADQASALSLRIESLLIEKQAPGGSSAENIAKACHALLLRDGGAGPTLDECRAVIDFLTYRQFDSDARFTEQPFVFYPVSPELVFWDYFRHGGLLRCLARQLTRDPKSIATRAKKGTTFEAAINRKAAGSLTGARGIGGWLLRKGKRAVWDIDIGFIYQDILFLVEAKNEQKSIRYYFEGTEISGRTQGRELLLQKMDDNLQHHLNDVRTNWKDCGNVDGAICVVCTIEAEFIASTDANLWLDMFTCPRICMLEELMTFLAGEDAVAPVPSLLLPQGFQNSPRLIWKQDKRLISQVRTQSAYVSAECGHPFRTKLSARIVSSQDSVEL